VKEMLLAIKKPWLAERSPIIKIERIENGVE